jgi:hypothetical protein
MMGLIVEPFAESSIPLLDVDERVGLHELIQLNRLCFHSSTSRAPVGATDHITCPVGARDTE